MCTYRLNGADYDRDGHNFTFPALPCMRGRTHFVFMRLYGRTERRENRMKERTEDKKER